MRSVRTTYGEVSGITVDGCEEFLGVPFARPPVGDLAFRHPVPPNPWKGVRRCDHGSANPIQAQNAFSVGKNSEDCLYLNIFVPENRTEKLPVMVWLFGGSYATGGIGSKSETDPSLLYELGFFARATDTIVVSVNYRLNLYGFMNLRFLSDRFDMNNGLYDQAMALDFIRDNIEAFGGDRENITVFGQSAGGSCALSLMVSDFTSSLFQRAIVQSACIDHFWTEEESEKITRKFLHLLGVSVRSPEALLTLDHGRVTDAIQKLDRKLLLKGEIRCTFSPVIDGVFLKDTPKRLMRTCRHDLLIGHTAQEANLYVKDLPKQLLPLASSLFHIRPEKGDAPLEKRLSDALTDVIYHAPMEEIIADYPGKLWVYLFSYVTPQLEQKALGACHISDLAVLFHVNTPFCDIFDTQTSRVGHQMRQIWSAFAHGQLQEPEYHRSHEVIDFKSSVLN